MTKGNTVPLTYDMTSVKDWEILNSDKTDHSKSHYLALILQVAGVPDITESTWNDAWVRIELLQKIECGFLKDQDGKAVWYTPEDIFRRIGYTTNAGTVTWSAFIKNLRTSLQFQAGSKILDQSEVA